MKKGVPRGAWVLIAAATVLFALGLGFAILWDPPKPVSARVAIGASGEERLLLSCEDCPDGTVVKLASRTAEFHGGKAELELEQSLPVGVNALTVQVERPGMGRDERLELSVPVDYRVRGDLTALDEATPKLRVAVEAEKGSTVIVGGKAVALDDRGRGHYDIELGSVLMGQKDRVVPIERKVPYTVKTPDGEVHEGTVTVRVGITPLRIDAPGEHIVIDDEHFMLTGRTAEEGVLTVAGRPITVDASGRFSQLMNVSSVGETQIVVRATAKGNAPRIVKLQVKRVDDLETEAAAFKQGATTSYAEYAAESASRGLDIVAEGKIIDARVDNHSTVVLMEVTEDCAAPPCLARVLLGEKLAATRDDPLAAYGHLTRLVDGPRSNQRIPEIRARFVLTGAAAR